MLLATTSFLGIVASERRVVDTEVKFGNCPSVRACVRACVRPVKKLSSICKILQKMRFVHVFCRFRVDFYRLFRTFSGHCACRFGSILSQISGRTRSSSQAEQAPLRGISAGPLLGLKDPPRYLSQFHYIILKRLRSVTGMS